MKDLLYGAHFSEVVGSLPYNMKCSEVTVIWHEINYIQLNRPVNTF